MSTQYNILVNVDPENTIFDENEILQAPLHIFRALPFSQAPSHLTVCLLIAFFQDFYFVIHSAAVRVTSYASISNAYAVFK